MRRRVGATHPQHAIEIDAGVARRCADRTDRTHRPAPTTPPRAVAAASVATSTRVRPDDCAPTTSETSPAPPAAAERAIQRGDTRGSTRLPGGWSAGSVKRAVELSALRAGSRAGEWPVIAHVSLYFRLWREYRQRDCRHASGDTRQPIRSGHPCRPRLQDACRAVRAARTATAPEPPRGWLHRVAGALTHRNLPLALVRRARLDDRHLDAELRAELARLRPDAVEFLSGDRRLPQPAADPAVHADWRRHRRSARSPAAAHRLAVRAGVFGVFAGAARLHRPHHRLAHLRAVVHLRLRPGVRRPGVSVA